ncbi:hypothetical protein EB093_06040 [bacterium]|nr:hypothetical protein [bacterium]
MVSTKFTLNTFTRPHHSVVGAKKLSKSYATAPHSRQKVLKKIDWKIPIDTSSTAVSRQSSFLKGYAAVHFSDLPSDFHKLSPEFFNHLATEVNHLADNHIVDQFNIIECPSDQEPTKRSITFWSHGTFENAGMVRLSPIDTQGLKDGHFCTSFADPTVLPSTLTHFISLTGSLFLSTINPKWTTSKNLGVQLVIRTMTHHPNNREPDLSIMLHRDLPYIETMPVYSYIKGISHHRFNVHTSFSKPIGTFGQSSVVLVNNREVSHSVTVTPKVGEVSQRHLFSWSTFNVTEIIDRAKNPYQYE